MRILKGWTKEERKELEEAKDNDSSSAMGLINDIGGDYDYCQSLTRKYIREDINDNNQMAKDIVDFYCGNAKFSEQKYYVKLIKDNDGSYLNRSKLTNFLILDGCSLSQDYQTEFTEQEIKDIDPRYMAFAVPVEEDNE